MPEVVLDKREAAEALGVSHRTITRLIEAGKIRSFKVGQQVRIREKDLDAFVQAQLKAGVR